MNNNTTNPPRSSLIMGHCTRSPPSPDPFNATSRVAKHVSCEDDGRRLAGEWTTRPRMCCEESPLLGSTGQHVASYSGGLGADGCQDPHVEGTKVTWMPPHGSSSETASTPILASMYRMIGEGGIHDGSADNTLQPRLFPESLYRSIHDGGLHKLIARRVWLHIWLLPGAFLCLGFLFLALYAPMIVCARALYLACFGGCLADLQCLAWYAPFLPLVFFFASAYEIIFYLAWARYRELDQQHFDPTYSFPVLHLCLRVVEHGAMWWARCATIPLAAGLMRSRNIKGEEFSNVFQLV